MSDTPETQSAAIIAKLREYNLWRRGDNQLAQPNPTEIGLYIDAVCDIAERREENAAKWEALAHQLAAALGHSWFAAKVNQRGKLADFIEKKKAALVAYEEAAK
jgi:hypothetical protein